MEHKGTVQIETERLILRRFAAEDAQAAFQNWMHDDCVTKFLRWPTHKDISVTKWVLSDWITSYSDNRFYQWAIVPKDLCEPIGSISAVDLDDRTEKVHIGYCIGSKWWNRGYTSEALSAVIEFFFMEIGANRVEAQHDPENPNSGKVMQKCGMKYEGTLRKADWSNRGIVDACIYSILRNEYGKH